MLPAVIDLPVLRDPPVALNPYWQRILWDIMSLGEFRHVDMLCGRREGKTEWACRYSGKFHLNGRNTRFVGLSETLADENWTKLTEMYEAWASPKYNNKRQKGTIGYWNDQLQTYGFLRRVTLNSQGGGRGGDIGCLIIDEQQFMSQEDNGSMQPLLLASRGTKIGTLTPPDNPSDYLRADWQRTEIFEGTQWYGMQPGDTTHDVLSRLRSGLPGKTYDPRQTNAPAWGLNPAYPNKLYVYRPTQPETIAWIYQLNDAKLGIDQGWKNYLRMAGDDLAGFKHGMGSHFYSREFELIWKMEAGNRVYDIVEEGIHIHNRFDYDPRYPVYWSIDYGGTNTQRGTKRKSGSHVLLFGQMIPAYIWRDKQIFAFRVFDELSIKSIISAETMLQVATLFSQDPDYKPPMSFSVAKSERKRPYPLPAGVMADPRATFYPKAIVKAGYQMIGSGRTVHIEPGIQRVRYYAEKRHTWDDVGEAPLLQIHPRCQLLRQNILAYERDQVTGEPKDVNNDAADDLRYMIWYLTNSKGLAGIESMEVRAAKTGDQSGSGQVQLWQMPI